MLFFSFSVSFLGKVEVRGRGVTFSRYVVLRMSKLFAGFLAFTGYDICTLPGIFIAIPTQF